MKKYIIILSVIALVVTGCTSRSGESAKRNKIVKVKQLTYNIATNKYTPLMGVRLMLIDSLYTVRDTITNNKGIFIIIN
jgi:uncharacterized protein YcfL